MHLAAPRLRALLASCPSVPAAAAAVDGDTSPQQHAPTMYPRSESCAFQSGRLRMTSSISSSLCLLKLACFVGEHTPPATAPSAALATCRLRSVSAFGLPTCVRSCLGEVSGDAKGPMLQSSLLRSCTPGRRLHSLCTHHVYKQRVGCCRGWETAPAARGKVVPAEVFSGKLNTGPQRTAGCQWTCLTMIIAP
jgi:hypothetical protein